MSLWTLRHPPVNRQGRCIGQSQLNIDIPLSEAVRIAIETAPVQPKRLVSSDQPRCADLAAELGKCWGLQPEFTSSLREMNFGAWEGRHYDDIDRDDHDRWRYWCEHWETASPPGGESLPVFSQRIQRWITENAPFRNTAVVTHAGVIRTLHGLSGLPWSEAMALKVPYLGWTHHEVDQLVQEPHA